MPRNRLIVLAPSREQANNAISTWWRERPGRRRSDGIYIGSIQSTVGLAIGPKDKVIQIGPSRRIRHHAEKVTMLERAAAKRGIKLTIEEQ